MVSFEIKFDATLRSDYAYNLYSELLRQLPADISDKIHKGNLISQYTKGKSWHLTVFDDSVASDIRINPEYFLVKHNKKLHVEDMSKFCINEREYCKNMLIDCDLKNEATMLFQTGTAFRSNGEYVNIPNVHFIMQSLLNKWNKYMPESRLNDIDVLQELEKNVVLSRYKLQSQLFSIKGVHIPSFVGQATIKLRGNEPFNRIVNMLLVFGSYSGVGIKTSLGMGGVKVI